MNPMDEPETIFAKLESRLGRKLLSRRLSQQATYSAGLQHHGEGIFVVEKAVSIDRLLGFFLKLFFLEGRGRRNCLDLRVVRNPVRHPAISQDLGGMKILQLTDLHIDLLPELADRVIEYLRSLDYDLVVFTGDYRNSMTENYYPSLELMGRILREARAPCFGILGNHDFIEKVPILEEMGMRLLLNEGVGFPDPEGPLWIGGVDDPHFYRTHDLVAAAPPDAFAGFRMLLAHSPEVYAEAASRFDFMLSGHTHGGQICLPGGIAVVKNGNCPDALLKGPWEYDAMIGYTSPGTGSCGIAARFFCPPEVTLHVLEAGGGEAEG